jgi:DHA1 family tetracycline resistance protein-like MFS transporter
LCVPGKRPLATLFLIVFTDLVGFGIVIPLLPLYAEHYNPAPWAFGMLMAAYSAMQFLFAPVLGRLSDRIGRRPVLIISLVGSFSGYLLFAAADSLFLLFISRIVAGVAGANIATAQAVIADITPRDQRARGMGLIGAAFGLGFIAGPAIAGGVIRLGTAAPGLVAAFFSLTALVMTLAFLPESLHLARRGATSQRWGMTRLTYAWRHREVSPLFAIGLAVVTGFSAFEVTFAQLVHDRFGLSEAHVAFLFVYVGVLAAAVQGTLVGRLARRLGERALVVAGLSVTGVGLALIGGEHRLLALTVTLPLLAAGQGVTMPSLSALISHAASEGRQGEVLGAYQGVSSLARVVGPFAGEIVLGHWGLGAPAFMAAALALLAAGGAATLLHRAKVDRERVVADAGVSVTRE